MSEPADQGEALAPGTPFGRYVITRRIGSGGMATVYEARHTDLAKRVALKTLHRALALRLDVVQRFVLEARTASRLEHPHVLAISDIGLEQGVPFMAMDLLEGEELTTAIQRDRGMPMERIADLLLPMMSAVAAAHDKGILHRDLKPENIFLARRRPRGEHPVLLDFGISKVHDSGAEASAEEILGTPPYMSPEQVQFGMARFNAHSDQYALGVILYECATGRLPYNDDDTMKLLVQVAHGGAPPPSAHRRSIPPAFDALVARAMRLKPEERFPSVIELGRALFPFASALTQAMWHEEFGAPPESVGPVSRAFSRAALGPADLADLPCFEGCSDATLAALCALAPGSRYPAGGLLFEQGSPPISCYVLVSGEIELSRLAGKGAEGRTNLKRGAILGMQSLVAGGPRAVTAVARTEVVVVELRRELWDALPTRLPAVANRLVDHLAVLSIHRLRAATARLAELLDQGDREGAPRERELVRLQAAIAEWGAPMAEPPRRSSPVKSNRSSGSGPPA